MGKVRCRFGEMDSNVVPGSIIYANASNVHLTVHLECIHNASLFSHFVQNRLIIFLKM